MALQDRYSKAVDAKLRAESIFAKLMNTKCEGTPAAGAVKIPVRAEAAVGDYDISNGKSLAHTATTFETLTLAKDRAVNELIDGYEAAAVPDGIAAERCDSAGFALADDIDTYLVTMLTTNGTANSNTTALTKSTAYESIIDDIQAAVAKKVKKSEMWVVVDPSVYGLLLKSNEFLQATGNVEDLAAGYIGRLAGVPVYESANMPAKHEYIVGNNVFCHFVDDWSVPVGIKDLADGVHIGASAVQGRKVYGGTITKAATVIYKKHA